MKRKFSKILGVGLTLALLVSMLVTVAPVSAVGTEVTDVYVDFPFVNDRNDVSNSGANIYLVHFKPATALKRGADWVTVTFPDGTSAMGPDNFTVGSPVLKAEVEFSTNYGTATTVTWVASTSNATVTGYRVKVRIPINVAANADVWLRISSTNIVAPVTASNNYKMYVQTTKDTARVLSSAFSLDGSVMGSFTVTATTDTAGLASEYIFTFQTSTLGASTVTVKLPVGVVLPSSIDADEIFFNTNGGPWSQADGTPVVDVVRRTITALTTVTLATGADNKMRVVQAAGITNPTTAGNAYHAMIKTNIDAQWFKSTATTDILAGTATKLGFTSTSDDATILYAYTGDIVIQSQDVNGNLKAVSIEPYVALSVVTGAGAFYTDQSNAAWGTSQQLGTGTLIAYYRPTSAGTHIIKAEIYSGTSITETTMTVYVAPAVVLTDSADNEIGTYGPSSGSTDDTTYGGVHIQAAINDAAAGDTVTLGDGIYEVGVGIVLSQAITLTKASGATPILRPTTNDILAIEVTIQGTAVNPTIIDGLTFTRLDASNEFDRGIRSFGYDYVTVRNNTFNYIRPGWGADDPHGSVIFIGAVQSGMSLAFDTSITSATISGNTFNNSGTTSGGKAAVINVAVQGGVTTDRTVTGVVISDNIFNDTEGYAIILNGVGQQDNKGYVTATISGNTLTNPYDGIGIWRDTKNVKVTGNTVTGAYQYALRVEVGADSIHANLVIKNNTFTGTAGAHPKDAVVIIDQDGDIDSNPPTPLDPVTIQYNAIYDNDATYSIRVASDLATQDAQYNWYGDASGPETSVSGSAITTPWLHKSLATVVANNASYPTFSVSLSVGWNTLSVPGKLISTADALNELVPAGMTIAYRYDGGWVQTTTDVINPLDAIYIKMGSAQTVLLKVDGAAFSTPTKSLAAGWNLIGLASLTPKTDEQATASLASASFGLLVSPSMNADEWVYTTSFVGTLAIGEGYWIFMKSAATIAGFTILPMAPSLN